MVVEPMEPKAWSFSSLASFETCPRRHYITRVGKLVQEKEGDAILWGNEVHKAIENKLVSGVDLPKSMKGFDRVVDKVITAEGQLIVEQQLALTKDYKPTGWFDNDVWVRGVIDAGVIANDTAMLIDWKTGKVKDSDDQLKLFAALAFAHYPKLNKVKTAFVWLKDRRVTMSVFTRDQISEIWQDFSPRVARYDNAFTTGKWNPKPSGLCRNYCPVTPAYCEHCGR